MRSCIPVVFLCCALFRPAQGVIPVDGGAAAPTRVLVNDQKINDDTGSTNQMTPVIAMHPYGPAVVCWTDGRLGTRDIFFQLFGRRGQKFGTLGNMRVNDNLTRPAQLYPASAAMDGNGHFAVGWTSEQGEDRYHVYIRLYLANGNPFGGIARVDDGPDDNTAMALSVAMDDTGNTVAAWMDLRDDPFGDIFAQRFDPSGRKVGSNVIVHSTRDGYQLCPVATMNGSGNGIVFWEDYRSGANELYARRFGPGMVPKGQEFGAGSQTPYSSSAGIVNHDAAVQPDGSFALCWIEGSFPGKLICRGRLYASTGAPLTPAFRVDEAEEFEEITGMRVTADPSGGYTFAWTGVTADDANIYARSCDSQGNLGLPGHAVNDLPGIQMFVELASDNANDRIFVWADMREGNADIYGAFEGVNRPSALSAGSGFDGIVPITWEPYYGQHDPGSFEIYRTDSQSRPFSLVATVNSPDPWIPNRKFDWIDFTAVNGTSYYYLVKAELSGITGTSKIVEATPFQGGHALRSTWSVSAPVIDGRLSSGEWDDAAVADISSPDAIRQVRLFTKNSGSFLYLAVDDSNDVFVETATALGFLMDLNHDRAWDAAPPSDEGGVTVTQAGAAFHAFWGRYPDHLGAAAPATAEGIRYLALASSGHVQHEAAIDLTASPLKAAAGGTIGFAVWSADPGNFYAYQYGNASQWPAGALWEAAETLGSLTLAEETGISDRSAGAPESFSLGQNYPNPFNPSTTIRFQVTQACRVVLKVVDLRGREMSTAADAVYPPGEHTVRFDATGLQSGLYIYRIDAGGFHAARKMAVMK